MFAHPLVHCSTQRDTLVGLRGNHSLLAVVSQAEIVGSVTGPSREPDIVTGDHSGLIEEILPVDIYIVILIRTVLVLSCELAHLYKFGAVHHRIVGEDVADTVVTAVTQGRRLSDLAGSGGDQDYTVRPP